MKPSHEWLKRLPALFEIPVPDPPRLLRRIKIMERNIMLPAKAVIIGIILYSFHSTPWYGLVSSTPDVLVETIQDLFRLYVWGNVALAILILGMNRLPLAVVQWMMVTSSLVDALFVAGLASISDGLDSILFWLFVALIVRNAVSMPPGFSQLMLNTATCLCYVLVGALEAVVNGNLDDTMLRALGVSPHEDWGEPFILRLVLLCLTMVCCYGAQVLLERVEEAEEFAAREGQLRATGRLAAEVAHQIKNPLAIINNAAFSLQRSLRDGKNGGAQQIEIIQEEVARADRVITQIMGYAQLSEGRVEKLNVLQELDSAIKQVFPSAVPTQIKIHREYGMHFPPLHMQRIHLSEMFVNLLQNARDALGDQGNVFVTAEYRPDYSIEISVRDDGPGIPPDKIERVFEAYYTTKEKGSGLGLAIVKHNVELYGGLARAESKLGQGTKFTLIFPAKVLTKK
ncbi:MAG TPA: HAMP domain-containing sensor histidine kinase [Candidatus Aquilonibacter sp.]|nr:HAMP domain-containing sensor histidine kinase [Candidatus Aquilonibacter sp.]